MYESGNGVEKDIGKALGWYALAARSGSKLAIKRLAVLVPELKGPKAPERIPPSPEDIDTTTAGGDITAAP
jgi:TPR repeat protein